MVQVFFSACLESVVVVFLEGDGLVMKRAHLGASVCDSALACELAVLVWETRIAAIEGHGSHLRHVGNICIPEGQEERADGVGRAVVDMRREKGMVRDRASYLSIAYADR